MAVVHKTVFLPYSAEKMFLLVDQVEYYPVFLPWCEHVEVCQREENKVVATLHIGYCGIKQHFTTENIHEPFTQITMTLVNGPFKHLDGMWQFIALREDACQVQFDLDYKFSNKLLEMLIGPVFQHIADNFVDAFCQHAQKVYTV